MSQLNREINDQLSGLLRRVSTDRSSPRDLWPDSSTVVPSPPSTTQEYPLTSPSPKAKVQKFRKPKVGDLMRIRSKDGEWMGTPQFKIMRGKTKPQLSDSTPGATVQASDIRVKIGFVFGKIRFEALRYGSPLHEGDQASSLPLSCPPVLQRNRLRCSDCRRLYRPPG